MQSPLTSVDVGPDPDWIPPSTTVGGKPVKKNKFPGCQEVFDAYYQCVHVDQVKMGKFLGACNQFKMALDSCNDKEQVVQRKANLAIAKERNRIIAERMAANEAKIAAAQEEAAKAQTGNVSGDGKRGWFGWGSS